MPEKLKFFENMEGKVANNNTFKYCKITSTVCLFILLLIRIFRHYQLYNMMPQSGLKKGAMIFRLLGESWITLIILTTLILIMIYGITFLSIILAGLSGFGTVYPMISSVDWFQVPFGFVLFITSLLIAITYRKYSMKETMI